jgi:hypothetical protein
MVSLYSILDPFSRWWISYTPEKGSELSNLWRTGQFTRTITPASWEPTSVSSAGRMCRRR